MINCRLSRAVTNKMAESTNYTVEYLKNLNYQELRLIGRGFDIGGKLLKTDVLVKEILKRQSSEDRETQGETGAVYTVVGNVIDEKIDETKEKGEEKGELRRRTYELSPPDVAKTPLVKEPMEKPREKQTTTEMGISKSAKRILEDKSAVKFVGTPAPDFGQIHKRLFGRMDSLTDYADKRNKRALMMRTPVPFLVPGKELEAQATDTKVRAEFTPKVLSTQNMNLVFNSMPVDRTKLSGSSVEVCDVKRKPKFDLQTSLARKMRYVPHQGRLRMLGGNTGGTPGKNNGAEEVEEKRDVRRLSIRGVRSNKRFELQLKMRGLI